MCVNNMPKFEKPTIETFRAKQNKDSSFEERAKKFEDALKPLTEELGVNYMAVIQPTQTAIHATIVCVDLWQKNESTPPTT